MNAEIYNPNAVVGITKTAALYLKEQTQKQDALGIKLSLMPGGCSGFEYKWEYVYEYFEEDSIQVSHYDDFVFVIDLLSKPMLEGSIVDVEDKGLQGFSLIVKSPNAQGSCGCGESVAF
jgi:iron-sulfur cluster insertion protein